jgi:flagellar hook protein FlgE
MFTSFSTALSALSAQATAVDVIGNNLANLNTSGFKANAVSFHDLVTQSLGTGLGETQVGFGVGRPTTIRQFSQGAIQSSNGPLDAAIQGDGFLVVKDSAGAILYTRGGNLQVDKNGALLSATGEALQGWTAFNGVLATNGPTSNIVVPVGTLKPPTATTSFSFDMNLNAAATAGPPPDQFSSSIEIFDSLGASHIVTIDFTKNAAANQWDYSIDLTAGDTTAPLTPVTGTITFDTQGILTNPPQAGPMPTLAIAGLVDGAADMTLTWNMYNGTVPRLTQFSQTSAVSANTQDGSPAAQLVRVALGDGGTIRAQYSNGTQTTVGQLAMAAIRNPESLVAVGNNNYQLSERSALPAIGPAGTGGRGTIMGGAIESSTVDIAREFTQLIVFQRGYQANSKVITTVDEMSQVTINLKQ